MTDNTIPTDAADITFGTPAAPARGRKNVWMQRLEAMIPLLEERRNEWAVFRSGLTCSYAYKTAQKYGLRYDTLEFTYSKNPATKTYDVWVRFPAPF